MLRDCRTKRLARARPPPSLPCHCFLWQRVAFEWVVTREMHLRKMLLENGIQSSRVRSPVSQRLCAASPRLPLVFFLQNKTSPGSSLASWLSVSSLRKAVGV